MKSVMISIQPKWCELIASGKKTVEVRKTRPKIDTPFKCYIYCTNRKDNTYWKNHYKDKLGKVIGEFVCDKVYDIETDCDETGINDYDSDWMYENESSRLSYCELDAYLQGKNGYGWHISDLVIYEKPKELHHFFKPCGDCDKKGTRRCTEELTECRARVIERPPQSWCYVEGAER